jgi:hypothetical protein
MFQFFIACLTVLNGERMTIIYVSVLFHELVAGFAPTSRRTLPSLKMGFETAEGAQPPLGLWDPLGWLNDADEAKFEQLRFAELKHGRIAMLGVVGHVTQQFYRFPGFIDLDGKNCLSQKTL